MSTIKISEWLPNPVGADAAGEWVELWNPSNVTVDLAGWRLSSDGKKFFALDGTMSPGGRLVVHRSESKVALRNSDGRLALYDATGRLADQASFMGSAPENQSVNRVAAGVFFGTPTPGGPNAVIGVTAIPEGTYPLGVPLNAPLSASLLLPGFMLGTAVALTVAVMYILSTHEDLSNLFFERDAHARRGAG